MTIAELLDKLRDPNVEVVVLLYDGAVEEIRCRALPQFPYNPNGKTVALDTHGTEDAPILGMIDMLFWMIDMLFPYGYSRNVETITCDDIENPDDPENHDG